jgi:hypothetical protein
LRIPPLTEQVAARLDHDALLPGRFTISNSASGSLGVFPDDKTLPELSITQKPVSSLETSSPTYPVMATLLVWLIGAYRYDPAS